MPRLEAKDKVIEVTGKQIKDFPIQKEKTEEMEEKLS